MKKIITLILTIILICTTCIFSGCSYDVEASGSKSDIRNTINSANTIQYNQPTPTDLEYSLERYNLIRRAYWVNGQREKANALPCEIEKPLGYIVLFSGNVVVGNFVVDGKVSSLNSYLTPDSKYYEADMNVSSVNNNDWLADVDGSYGSNDNGIFFFTPDGKYIEWTGTYLYSDIPFEVDSPILIIGGND
jgi:dipeptidyl aminopeptidase/acylaminoacyl peptidase